MIRKALPHVMSGLIFLTGCQNVGRREVAKPLTINQRYEIVSNRFHLFERFLSRKYDELDKIQSLLSDIKYPEESKQIDRENLLSMVEVYFSFNQPAGGWEALEAKEKIE